MVPLRLSDDTARQKMKFSGPFSDAENGVPIWMRVLTLAVLCLYPLAWYAPLMRAGFLPLFGLDEISVVTGLRALWQTDIVLALIVTVFALVAPMIKTLGMILIQWSVIPARGLKVLNSLGKLAMADVFLIALYITVIKGIGVGRVEVAWGLYLFSGCIIASLILGLMTARWATD